MPVSIEQVFFAESNFLFEFPCLTRHLPYSINDNALFIELAALEMFTLIFSEFLPLLFISKYF